MHETLVILMHSFNSLLWNLAPASLIMVGLKPHGVRSSSVKAVSGVHTGCLPSVCAQCTQHRRLYTEFRNDLTTFHKRPQLLCQ